MALDTQRREQLLDRCARRIADLGMAAPAILFLEAYKPLSFLGAQLLWIAQPFLNGVFNPADLRDFTLLVQDDAGAEALIARLEAFQENDSASQAQHRT
jgi:hypothetical protein